MISPGYLGLLKSLSKLETRYINNIVRKNTKQKRTFTRKRTFKKELLQFKKNRNKIVALSRIRAGFVREGYCSKYFEENKKHEVNLDFH